MSFQVKQVLNCLQKIVAENATSVVGINRYDLYDTKLVDPNNTNFRYVMKFVGPSCAPWGHPHAK